ncbi:MAG: flagellar filament capping protein FliD [Spirochaetia bacterium]|jgi:flagellar hook-associated protein 2|nr:flagellar filament capping protein FliD [Spirochaetia bacterium]
MSDISIPGVNSKYGTDKMIEGLMDAERIPLRRLEDQKDTFGEKKEVWQEINTKLNRFKESSKLLFGFQNPFQEHVAESSDETVATAIAGRDSLNEKIIINVEQLAGSDRFLSGSLPKDFRVPEGIYSFQIGDDEVSFKFKENRLQSFVEAINKRSKGLLRAKLINDSSETIVFMIETTKTGSSNKLILSEDSVEMGISTGLIKTINESINTVDFNAIQDGISQSSTNSANFSILDKTLTLEPESEIRLPFKPEVLMKNNLVLEYSVQIKNLEKEEYNQQAEPSGPEINSPGSINFEGITIENSPSRVTLPKWSPPPKPVFRESLDVIYLNDTTLLPKLKDIETIQKFSIPYSITGNNISSIDIKNINTHRQIIISEIKIVNQEARNGYEPVNPVASALDAKLSIDGIPVTRDTNSIDDLIQGVTLELTGISSKDIEIDIKPDKESIKNGIIAFVGNYNQVLQNIHILTSNDAGVISELEYLTNDEKETAKKNLGVFQGDMTFSQLKNRLQQIAMEAYETTGSNNLSLLAQIGISTNSSGFGGGINKTKLRGYLEINEDKLDESLTGDVQQIKELFGTDTDGDLIIDTGAAYEMDRYISSYTQIGGLVSTRISGIDNQIKTTETNILNMNRKLDDKELELRIKFGRMESALKTMEDSSRSIENFSNNNN